MESVVNYPDTITPGKEWRLPGDTTSMIRILETELGPLISESRSSVYDVMEAYDEGYSPTEISAIYICRSNSALSQKAKSGKKGS